MARRTARITRKTGETSISVSVDIDGRGRVSADTGYRFIDHMIAAIGKHSLVDISVKARSLDGIEHHLIEDTAIALGSCVDKALGRRAGIARFGHASVPMDESLAEASVDLVRRPYGVISLKLKRTKIEDVRAPDLEHFFQSLVQNLNCCVHIGVRYGRDDHHKAEAAAKSLAVALRMACAPDKRQRGIPSTKGAM